MAKKGGYNRLNYLNRCKIIIDIVNAHYIAGITTYSGVFRAFVKPFYPMGYKSFMKIMSIKNINRQISELENQLRESQNKSEEVNPNQLNLFE